MLCYVDVVIQVEVEVKVKVEVEGGMDGYLARRERREERMSMSIEYTV